MLCVVILAAGKGTRMNDLNIPKVCRKVGNKTMIEHVVTTSLSLNPQKIIIVVSKENLKPISESLRNLMLLNSNKIFFVKQEEVNGTASAVLSAKKLYKESNILVLLGDVPLLKPSTLKCVINCKTCGILGFVDNDLNNKFGRIVIDDKQVVRIIEYTEASDKEREILQVNSGILYLNHQYTNLLEKIDNHNSKKEYFLTDIVKILRNENISISYIEGPKQECLGANTPTDLQNINNLIL